MRAVACRRYGPPGVLQIEDVERPVPKADEVLVAVHSTSVTSGDARMRSFKGAGVYWLPMALMFGVLRPRNPITGMEFSGRIAEIGKDVITFRVGDPVFGMRIGGANAEYVAVREMTAIASKPESLSFADAAVTPFGALSALEFLRDVAKLKAGEQILIHGASGAVGVFAVQIAKHMGATVTGVCSGANVELVKSLGADEVIDYTRTDFTQTQGVYDVILDTVGGTSFSRSKRVLAANGRHVFVVQDWPQLLQALWTSMRPGKRVICGMSGGDSKADLVEIAGLIEQGVIKPVVDRTYPLDAIADAHRYVDMGRKRGGVVISVAA
jgi:NADPH:quinone reductase-like Zn-dependent oxidoreductase